MAIDPNSSSSSAAAAAPTTTNPIQRAPPRPTTTTISPQTQLPRLPSDLFSPTTTTATIRPRNYLPTATISSSAPPPPSQGIPYPVVSSGRGFMSLPKSADHAVTVANPNPNPIGGAGGYPPRPVANYVVRPIQHIHHYHHHPYHNYHYQQPHIVAAAAATAGPVKGVSVPVPLQAKVAPSSVPERNGYKDIRDKSRDDSLTIVRDRKVRVTEGASLYALCRSWLRNGFPEESQPQYGDVVRSLPKPLPVPMTTSNLQKKKEDEKEEDDDGDEKEDEESVENFSAEDLFKRHVKRAKKVRARLREVRLKRIARYKPRLALLLPPMREHFRNDAAAGT